MIGDLNAENALWREAFMGVDAVIHTAARVHQMHDRAEDPLKEFCQINTQATRRLAQYATSSGVKRFIFLSSLKVNGEKTETSCPFTPTDLPNPHDPYSVSKLYAEQAIADIAHKTGMAYTIIRPPLIYGPGVKGNFASLMHWLKRGIPLPLGSMHHNRRSLLALDNLIDLLVTCLDHPGAINETFLASDNEDLSTTDLLQRIAQAMGVKAHLIPFPSSFVRGMATAFGKANVYQKLCGSLQVDMTKTQRALGWSPPITVDEGLRRAVTGLSHH
jgi:UDP-glucose 4-epimerase